LVFSTSGFEVGWASQLAAQLGNILCETQTGKTGSKARAERRRDATLVPHRVAEDLTDFLFSAAAMTARAALKLDLHVIIEVSDQELSHGRMISRMKGKMQATILEHAIHFP
jgi:hypothetical protein